MKKNVIKSLEQEHKGKKYEFPLGAKAENIETDDERQFVSKEEKMKISEIDTMKQSFQAGVDTLYNKCKGLGFTPAGKNPGHISDTIDKIYADRYAKGVSDADSRVNTDSESYKKGFTDGKASGVGAKMCYKNEIGDSNAYLNSFTNPDTGHYSYGATFDESSRRTTIEIPGRYSIMISDIEGYAAFYRNEEQIKVIGHSFIYFECTLEEGDTVFFTGSSEKAEAYIDKIPD